MKWQPLALAALVVSGTQGPRIPFEPGLTVTWAAQQTGDPDFETRLELVRSDSTAATLRVTWNRRSAQGNPWVARVERQMMMRARQGAHVMSSGTSEQDTTNYASTVSFMASSVMLDELKHRGQTTIGHWYSELAPTPYRGVITRVGESESFPVIVNGKRVSLRGIRAEGTFTHPSAAMSPLGMRFLFLDDPVTPWLLEIEATAPNGQRGFRQMIRVSFPAGRPEVERELETRCRASVYDIYFATGSADFDSASAPMLSTIARALTDHRDWRVTIVGHTDSIGKTDANLDLSRRRAERVRAALTSGYRVGADRLRAEGRGESQPVEDNGTITGRARNRRVELVRECG